MMVVQYLIRWLSRLSIFFLLLLMKRGTYAATQQYQNFSIPEEMPVGTVIGTIGEGMVDVPSPFRTHVAPVPGKDLINDLEISLHGIITTKVVLDRETTSKYSLFAFASNENIIEIFIQVLDINDNKPIFAKGNLNIPLSESTPRDSDTPLGSATDKDNGINSTQGYDIISGNEDNMFRLGTKRAPNDVLFLDLEVNGTLDYETKSNYYLKIEAYDGGNPKESGYMTVNISIVDTNDNQPIFNQSVYSAKIQENSTINTSVLQVWATDQDSGENGKIRYHIDHGRGDLTEHFAISPVSGVVSVKKKLDYEKKSSYELIIIASDNGTHKQQTTAVVSISVTDVNDNKPEVNLRFLTVDSTGRIPANAQQGSFLAQISVTDPDLPGLPIQANMTLKGGNGNFGLNKINDKVYLVLLKPLDSNSPQEYLLTVSATYSRNPALQARKTFRLYVTNTVNNAPLFQEKIYNAVIIENAPPGSFVIKVKAKDTDEDGSALTYDLAPSSTSYSDWFRIDSHTGLITTKVTVACENISEAKLLLRVTAEDSGFPPMTASAIVVVQTETARGSLPLFDHSFYNVSTPESTSVGTTIIKVSASERDCGQELKLAYRIQMNPGQSTPREIDINTSDGSIFISRSLDYESKSRYEFGVVARDAEGYETRAMVHIFVQDVNDNAPMFRPNQYNLSVSPGTLNGQEVLLLQASDADSGRFGRIVFDIISGNDGSYFSVNQQTGVLMVQRTLQSAPPSLRLEIRARDGGNKASSPNAVVVVTVAATDSSVPVFSAGMYRFRVQEGVGTETSVGTVQANNPSLDVRYSIVSATVAGLFVIDAVSGIIRPASMLDHEDVPHVVLTVQARSVSSLLSALVQANITIEDVNDNSPVFLVTNVGISVKENTSLSDVLYVAYASDLDSDRNGLVHYKLREPNSRFHVEPNSGKVLLRRNLDYESQKQHTISVIARDGGSPRSMSSTMTLTVNVQDINDESPLFNQSKYEVGVSESVPVNHIVFNVTATDQDSGNNARITYLLRNNSQSHKHFGVFPNTGAIYTKVNIDHEKVDKYELKVVACDNGNPMKSSEATVVIRVLDENDNAPKFLQDLYEFSLRENMRAGTRVGSVSARDRDKFSQLQYYMNATLQPNKDGEDYLFFEVSPTGIVTTKRQLDRESTAIHSFVLSVKDDTENYKTSTTQVTVRVDDENDNAPEFLTSNGLYVVHVKENMPVGTLVLQPSVDDKDKGQNARVRFGFNKAEDPGLDMEAFRINAENGAIFSRQELDHEIKSKYSFIIKAYDSGVPTKWDTARVDVIVDDVNENPPIFAKSKLSFVIPESKQPGSTIGKITAKDLDSGENARISYYIISGNVLGNFALNRTTGFLSVARGLDYDGGTHYYVLKVKAVDNSIVNPMSSIVMVNVSLIDVNDNYPQFTQESIVIFVPENTKLNEPVSTVTAIDSDSGDYGKVTYSIVSQVPDKKWFRINPTSGVIFVNSLIDYEEVDEMTLSVRARDWHPVHKKRLFTDIAVWVLVTDQNDNCPVFLSGNKVNLLEDEPVGYPVVNVIASDLDSSNNGNVTYTLTSGNQDDQFKLNSKTGLLLINKAVDREYKEVYKLGIRATDHGSPPCFTNQELDISIIDVNDNPPRFDRPMYAASIRENLEPGNLVTTVRATDNDRGKNAELSYFIPNGIAGSRFSVDQKSGNIYNNVSLDREEQSTWTITVYVADGAFPMLYDMTTVVVSVLDDNDNYPFFMDPVYELTVPENNKMSVIHTIKASDADTGDNSRINYRIYEGDPERKFSIDVVTGTLSCDPLDREKRASYNLTILASDAGHPPRTNTSTILITVLDDNDNNPEFRQSHYSRVIPEDSEIGTSLLKVEAVDVDDGVNAQILYSLDNGAEGQFKIDNNTGVLRTASEFDREKKEEYSFSVQAIDGGLYGPRFKKVKVKIRISDINDNAPVFEKIPYKARITLTHPIGTPVITVSATDKDTGSNGEITFTIVTKTDYFDIDNKTGVIRTTAAFTSSSDKMYHLNILAKDNGSPVSSSTGVVEIMVGDVQGTGILNFANTTYNVSLSENAARNQRVIQVQAAFDNSQNSGTISYSFASGDEDHVFSIHSSTGEILVADPSRLDYESQPKLRLVVVATSASNAYGYTYVWVTLLDENDNDPVFLQERYTSSVWEGNPRDTYVTQVIATDADTEENGDISYRIIRGDPEHSFVIYPPHSGIVKTRARLDREIHDSYKLTIVAMDNGRPRRNSHCTLRIQVIDDNDNVPTFGFYEPVTVQEGTRIGTVLLHVTANDVDLNPNLTYEFTSSGNPQGVFSIDRFSGKISLAKELDYEIQTKYTLVVKASDSLNEAVTNISVLVEDINDNIPEVPQQTYEVSLAEDTPAHTAVITINATDRDSGENGRISYSMLRVPGFYINPMTGTIYTNESVSFNPSRVTIYLVVTATDHGSPPRPVVLGVWVQIIDVNNHWPVFSQRLYSVGVAEDVKVNHVLTSVSANDADDSYDNRRIDYSITSGNSGVFQISTSTGQIFVTAPLDREKQSSYSLIVQATDRGTPRQSSTATVQVTVSDINDNKPVFSQSNYSVEVAESVELGSDLLTVYASDADAADNQRTEYSLHSGNEDQLFRINSTTGVISVNDTLDYEQDKIHKLVVMATDLAPEIKLRLSALVSVTVHVIDVNEYTPRFHVMMYFEEIQEKLEAGQFVFTAAADDLDGGEFGVVEYNIIDPNQYFTIDNITGKVTTTVVFTYSVNSSYIFNVTATDKGGKTTKVPASVSVKPRSDNIPVFSQKSYTFIVPGNAKRGYYIGTVRAKDPSFSPVTYRLEKTHHYFNINSTTGTLTVINDLHSDQARKRRSLKAYYECRRRKRALELDTEALVIVASSGGLVQQSNRVMVHMDIDRTCPGCALPIIQKSNLSTALILVIIFAIVALFLIALFVVLYLRSRYKRQKTPAHYSYNSSFDSLSVQPPPPPLHHEIPPPYEDGHSYHTQSHDPNSSNLSNRSASSGRGSVEEEDEEIRRINASNVQEVKGLVRGQMPDSGIQQDDDALSEKSAQNHQEYFARLGIDTGKLKSNRKNIASSVESMHQFSDEGGGEGDGNDSLPCDSEITERDTEPITISKLNIPSKNYINETDPSHAGSLSSVINSEEELSGSYNWDYLLDWGPQYQPLADVFAEIARLKDDAVMPKKQPTKIVPQRPNNTSLNTQPKCFPPPIITDIPPMSLGEHLSSSKGKLSLDSTSSSGSGAAATSARTSQLTSLPSLPRSPISHDSSYTTPVFSPSFTPSLSPLGTRSASISPLVTPKGLETSTDSTPQQQPPATLLLDGFQQSEQEQYI